MTKTTQKQLKVTKQININRTTNDNISDTDNKHQHHISEVSKI